MRTGTYYEEWNLRIGGYGMNWLPDWVLKILGHKIADKLDLQEDSNMETKPWYQSKNIWAGVVTALIGVYLSLAPQFHWPAIPEWIFTILGAIGIYTRATATTTITK